MVTKIYQGDINAGIRSMTGVTTDANLVRSR